MKKAISVIASAALLLGISACDKEQKISDSLTGEWTITNMVKSVNGKDSTFTGGKTLLMRFDMCVDAGNTTCSVALTVKGDQIKDDLFYPMAYKLADETNLTIYASDTTYYKIEEYKKDKLKLTGTTSDFSGTNNNIIEGTAK